MHIDTSVHTCVYIHTYIYTYFSHICSCILAGWNAPLPLRLGGLCKQAQLKINRDILRTGRYSRQRGRELVS